MACTFVVVAMVAHRAGGAESPLRYVVTRRRKDTHLGGQWELPGGRVEPDESPEDAMRRELREELGVEVGPLRPMTFAHHVYVEREVLLLFYETNTLPHGPEPQPLASDELRLLTLAELAELKLPEANAGFQELLRRRLT